MLDNERSVLNAVNEAILLSLPALQAAQLECSSPELDIAQQSLIDRESEVRIWIKQNGQIQDVIEFHIFQNGRLLLTAHDAAKMVSEEIQDILCNPNRWKDL